MPDGESSPAVPATGRRSPCTRRGAGGHRAGDAVRLRDPRQTARRRRLVVGASATGVQLAPSSGDRAAGTLAVGEHTRLPAHTYRGRDGAVVDGPVGNLGPAVRRGRGPREGPAAPLTQLVGTPERATLDLNALTGWASGCRAGGRRYGTAARCSPRPAQRVRARRPQAGTAAGHVRRVGRARGDDAFDRPERFARPAYPRRRGCSSTWPAVRSVRSCGRPATGPTTDGSRARSRSEGPADPEGGVVASPDVRAGAARAAAAQVHVSSMATRTDAREWSPPRAPPRHALSLSPISADGILYASVWTGERAAGLGGLRPAAAGQWRAVRRGARASPAER